MYDDLDAAGGLLDQDDAEHDAGAIRFQRVRDLSDVINATFRFLRDNLREYGRMLLVLLGPVVLITALASYFAQLSVYDTLGDIQGGGVNPNDPFAPLAGIFTPAYVLTILLGMIAPVLLVALTYGYIDLYRRGEAGTITPGRVWEEARHLVGPFLGYTVLFVVLALLSGVIAIVPCLGILAWMAGLIYVLPIASLAYAARATDRDGLGESVRRARALIRGRWWPSFGVVFVAMVIVFIGAMIVSIPSSMAGFGVMFSSLSGEPPAGVNRTLLAFGALLSTLNYALYAIPTVALAFLYGSLVEQEEGTALSADLDALADRAEAAPAAPARPFQPEADEGFGPWRPESSGPEPPPSDRPSGFRGGGFGDDAETGSA